MRSHDELLVQLLADPGVAAEYEALGEEFAVFDELTRARRQAGLTQAEVAQRMGTKPPAISRIEAPDAKHSPSLRTLQKYAQAVGCRLEIRLVQDRVRKPKAI
jgi:transcriptional regulator with XRE-family HTH domain